MGMLILQKSATLAITTHRDLHKVIKVEHGFIHIFTTIPTFETFMKDLMDEGMNYPVLISK